MEKIKTYIVTYKKLVLAILGVAAAVAAYTTTGMDDYVVEKLTDFVETTETVK